MEIKKLVLSLFALAALSGAAYANDYGNSNGAYIRKSADGAALVVIKKSKKKLSSCVATARKRYALKLK